MEAAPVRGREPAAVRLRPYAAADRDEVLALWRSASAVGHPFLGEADLAAQRLLVAEVYLPLAETWVAVEGEEEGRGSVVGFVGLVDGPGGGGRHVGGLFVAPDRHGRGIGRSLLEHALLLKGPPLTLEVYEANAAAVAFYARGGFAVVGRKKTDDQGRPLPLLTMRKDR
jgi:putative acetyltransferase